MNVNKTKEVIKYIASLMQEIKDKREDINDAISVQSEELGIDKKVLRKMAKLYCDQDFIDYKNDQENILESYDAIMNK